MKNVKEIWNYFKGKKRNIGVVAIWVLKATTMLFPELLPIEQQLLIRDGIDILLLGGTVDAVGRTNKGKEVINKALSITKIK